MHRLAALRLALTYLRCFRCFRRRFCISLTHSCRISEARPWRHCSGGIHGVFRRRPVAHFNRPPSALDDERPATGSRELRPGFLISLEKQGAIGNQADHHAIVVNAMAAKHPAGIDSAKRCQQLADIVDDCFVSGHVISNRNQLWLNAFDSNFAVIFTIGITRS